MTEEIGAGLGSLDSSTILRSFKKIRRAPTSPRMEATPYHPSAVSDGDKDFHYFTFNDL
jgi:hypothetical protein